MLIWATYALVISGIVTLAAISLERAIRPRGVAIRWVWACALLGSLALPLVLSSTRSQTGADGPVVHSPVRESPQVATTVARPVWVIAMPARLVAPEPGRLEAILEAAWLASSLTAAAVLVAGCWYGRRRRRSWRRASIADTELFVANDSSPATVGFLNPQIVLPEWLLSAAPDIVHLVVAHERSHVEARDPGLLGLGMVCLILMPWNALIWWQLHQLRLAIEVDCDRRVLRIGHDARCYAKTLVDVSTRRPGYLGWLAASPRSISSVERRLIIMKTPRIHGWRTSTAAYTLLSIGIAMAALFISPPAMPPALATTTGAAVPTGLERYVGGYQMSTISVLRVSLSAGRLVATFPGMQPQPLTRTVGREFRLGHYNAYLRFAIGTDGHVTGVVFEQNGAVTEAPRIGAGRVHAIDHVVASRAHAQVAKPGSERALRRLILGIQSGKPDYAELSPQLAAGTRVMLSHLRATMKPWGSVRSIEFQSVDSKGWDHYVVHFEHGTAWWGIALDSYGVVVGAGMTHPG